MYNTGIYSITNKVNGKRYIGSAVNINERWSIHRRMLNKGEHHSIRLQYSWNKHREENFIFEKICKVWETEKLIKIEQTFIDLYKSHDPRFGYNICKMAGSTLGFCCSEETKKKLRGENNPMFGKHHSEEARNKISEAGRGRRHSEITKKKISEAHKGKRLSEATKEKISKNHADVSGKNSSFFGKNMNGANSPKAILSWDQVHEIRRRYKEENILQRQLAVEYGVCESTVQHIIKFRTWKEEPLDG